MVILGGGQCWLQSLQGIDFDNRIPRGATYARQGMVKSVKFKDNVITAKVKGRRVTPYSVTIVIPPFFEEDIEKLMIFTQFRQMGELLQAFLKEALGEEPMFYHGECSTKERQKMIDRFQNNKSDRVFILSLKAAGTGENWLGRLSNKELHEIFG